MLEENVGVQDAKRLFKLKGKMFRRALKKCPNDPDALREMGLYYSQLPRFPRKTFIKNGEHLVKINPVYEKQLRKKAYDYYKKSLQYVTEVYQCDELMSCFLTIKDYSNVIKCLEREIEINPSLKNNIKKRIVAVKKMKK